MHKWVKMVFLTHAVVYIHSMYRTFTVTTTERAKAVLISSAFYFVITRHYMFGCQLQQDNWKPRFPLQLHDSRKELILHIAIATFSQPNYGRLTLDTRALSFRSWNVMVSQNSLF